MGREKPKRVIVKLNQYEKEIKDFIRTAENLKLRSKTELIKKALKLE